MLNTYFVLKDQLSKSDCTYRGTSSLQLSDSEEEKVPRPSLVHSHSTRRSNKNQNQDTNSASAGINADQTEMDQGANSKLGVTNDTDSVNENFSPVRPSMTKRKRKFKRMALDPDNNRCLINLCETIREVRSGISRF